MLILVERTPNPDALKFLPQMRLTDGRGRSFTRDGGDDVDASLLARAIFDLPDVARVYIGEDFVTVARAPDGEAWTTLRIRVIAAIAEALAHGPPAIRLAEEACAADGLEREIRDVLARHVRPGVARDGGDIVFDRLDPATGVLWVRMEGACGGCPSSRRTLKDAVERIVRRYVPEVTTVAEAEPSAEPRPPAWRRWLDTATARPSPRPRPQFRHNGRTFRD